MIKVGITGEQGFIGTHLYNTLGLYPDQFSRVKFHRSFFDDEKLLNSFVSSCDVIVHLAGVNRHDDPEEIYRLNILLAEKLASSLVRTSAKPHVIFSSSSQEEKDNHYGQSKKKVRIILKEWADTNNARFSGLIIPNVFGPFCKPFYNSVVATFCYQVVNNLAPRIDVDSSVPLVYVGNLVKEIIQIIKTGDNRPEYKVPHDVTCTVSEILALLKRYKAEYSDNAIFPELNSKFEIDLFNTYRSYEDIGNRFPVKFKKHVDERGVFSEIVKQKLSGQVSFSTTHPAIVRGNHFHTRKIERFAVIKGKALIQLRRTGTTEVFDFHLSGDQPSFVDMPVWYTHNIKNIGEEELITIFWINEFYNPDDPDTYFETV